MRDAEHGALRGIGTPFSPCSRSRVGIDECGWHNALIFSLCFEREVWFALFFIFFGRGQLAPGSAPARRGAVRVERNCRRVNGRPSSFGWRSRFASGRPKPRHCQPGEQVQWRQAPPQRGSTDRIGECFSNDVDRARASGGERSGGCRDRRGPRSAYVALRRRRHARSPPAPASPSSVSVDGSGTALLRTLTVACSLTPPFPQLTLIDYPATRPLSANVALRSVADSLTEPVKPPVKATACS